jgi:UDP-glucose 4-epimerase
VTVFDRFPDHFSQNLGHLRGRVRLEAGEFANRDSLARALENQDLVYHFICSTNPAESWNDPNIEIRENLINTIQLCELAGELGVKKIVFPSSGGAVYGSQMEPLNEGIVPRPFTPYGITKLATEHFLNYFSMKEGLAFDIYRIGNAYGPRQPVHRPQGVLAVWMWNLLNGRPLQVYGDTETRRDYVYIKDVAFLMTHSLKDLTASGLFNLGTGVGTSTLGLLEIFKSLVDQPLRYSIHGRRNSDNLSIVLDSSRLLAHFPGFKFQTLEEKIVETWEYFIKRHKAPSRSSLQEHLPSETASG